MSISILDNFREMLDYVKGQYAERVAFVYSNNNEQELITYETFCNDVLKLSRKFTTKRTPIGLLGENSYEWIITYLAIEVSDNIVIPLDHSANLETIVSEMETAECANIFYSDRFRPFVQEVQKNNKRSLLSAICMNNIQSDERDTFELYDQNNSEKTSKSKDLFKGASVVIFTSGTTSQSKGVLLTQQSIIANSVSATNLIQFYPKILLFLPLYHAFGITGGVFIPMLEGCTVILSNENYSILQNIQSSGANTILAVPAMVKIFRDTIIDAHNDVSIMGNVKQIVCGGATVAPELYDFFENIHIAVQIGYGLSECCCVVSINGNTDRRRNSVGQVVDCCSVKIMNPDQNGCGEILIAGKSIMIGYLDAPDLTAKAFDGEYFKSGDLGYMDDDGFIYITGRSKNLLVMSNGKKIAPEELESCICMIPHVKEAIVFLLMGERSHESVAAEIYIDPKSDSEKVRESVLESIDNLNRNLPIYKRIQRICFRSNEFEKTSTHKILRKPKAIGAADEIFNIDEEKQKDYRQLIELISKFSVVPIGEINLESDLFNDLGLDSLQYTSLMCEISDQFRLEFSGEIYKSINTVCDIVSIIHNFSEQK